MATMLKCCCVKISNLTNKKMFIRSLHILKKDCFVNQSYAKRLWHSRNTTSWLLNRVGALFDREHKPKPGAVNCRYYSSIEDDEMVKTWIKEIKQDFQNKNKVKDAKTAVSQDSDIADENNIKNETDMETFDKTVDRLEKHGFTSEEIIELLKSSKGFEDELFSDSSSDSDTDSSSEDGGSDIESGSSSDSDTDVEDGTKSGRKSDTNPGRKSDTDVSTSDVGNKMEQEDWAVVKMKDSIKSEWSEIEIEDFVNIAEVESDMEEWIPPVDLEHGTTGVFDVEDVVTVLRHANAQDVLTIRIPADMDFADYMVIASAKSKRHLKAITSDLQWIYKRRMYRKDRHFKVEGDDSDWHAVDLGNIILHVFMPNERKLYDLETLWTVGSKFDPKCMKEKDPYTFAVDDLPWLRELEEASGNKKQASVNNDQDHDEANLKRNW